MWVLDVEGSGEWNRSIRGQDALPTMLRQAQGGGLQVS